MQYPRFIFLFVTTCARGQIIDSFPWFKLDKIPNVNGTFKLAAQDVYQNLSFDNREARVKNTDAYKTKFIAWEKLIAKGQGGSLIAAQDVKSAKSKYPSDGPKDLMARHAMFIGSCLGNWNKI